MGSSDNNTIMCVRRRRQRSLEAIDLPFYLNRLVFFASILLDNKMTAMSSSAYKIGPREVCAPAEAPMLTSFLLFFLRLFFSQNGLS
jgi:hypothetical protein